MIWYPRIHFPFPYLVWFSVHLGNVWTVSSDNRFTFFFFFDQIMCVPCVCLVEYIYRIFVISISLSMLMQGMWICLMPLCRITVKYNKSDKRECLRYVLVSNSDFISESTLVFSCLFLSIICALYSVCCGEKQNWTPLVVLLLVVAYLFMSGQQCHTDRLCSRVVSSLF